MSLAALLAVQAPPPAPACYLLTGKEVATLVGKENPQITTITGTESICMYQNGDAILTVIMAKLGTADAAKGQWEAKKRVSAGHDAAGWPTPAYVGIIDTTKEHAAVVGVHSSLTFVEAKAIDPGQKTADLSARLQAAMKAYSGRLAAQK